MNSHFFTAPIFGTFRGCFCHRAIELTAKLRHIPYEHLRFNRLIRQIIIVCLRGYPASQQSCCGRSSPFHFKFHCAPPFIGMTAFRQYILLLSSL